MKKSTKMFKGRTDYTQLNMHNKKHDCNEFINSKAKSNIHPLKDAEGKIKIGRNELVSLIEDFF